MTADPTTAPELESNEAASPPDERRRFARYNGFGSDFAMGERKYLRKGDVIEVLPDDTRILSALATVSYEQRPDWLEVETDFVLAKMVCCDYCLSWRLPSEVEAHLERVHTRIGGQPMAELRDIWSQKAAVEVQIARLQKEKRQLDGSAGGLIKQLEALGIVAPRYSPDKELAVRLSYHRVGTEAVGYT